MSMTVEAKLAAGPLDIVGDVHGELDALHALLQQLGYGADGQHREGRHLVFVGDLCDRGPDSPGVIELVQTLIAGGRAQCVLGNHELSVLRGVRKAGNGWFFARNHDQDGGRYPDCRGATGAQREGFPAFLASLPLTLSREDLRVVHAAWHPASLLALAAESGRQPLTDIYREYHRRAGQWAQDPEVSRSLAEEHEQWGTAMTDEQARMPLLPATGRMNEHFQMNNPIRVLTSGVERLARQPFYATGKWRMVDRVAWWHDYRDEVPVIFGHYWRWSDHAVPPGHSRGEPDLFKGQAAGAWLGPHANAFCVDFSVGVRYRERPLAPGARHLGRLAAVRWPERELVFDDGEWLALSRE
ncbi:MAG: metallophosphoesterase [Gammaproteobacteria bacterium]